MPVQNGLHVDGSQIKKFIHICTHARIHTNNHTGAHAHTRLTPHEGVRIEAQDLAAPPQKAGYLLKEVLLALSCPELTTATSARVLGSSSSELLAVHMLPAHSSRPTSMPNSDDARTRRGSERMACSHRQALVLVPLCGIELAVSGCRHMHWHSPFRPGRKWM